MLETQLYFNYKDLFRAPRLALGRRMLVMLEALVASYAVFVIMTYLALLIEGHAFGSIWNDFHLTPPILGCLASTIYGHLLVALARIFSLIVIWLGLTAVAKITIKEYKGDLFYSSRDGWKWALKNWFPVFFGPISIAIVIGFFIVLAAMFGWLAQWPVLDIIFYGLLFVIFVPTALFLVFSALALLVGLYMSPSIVACAEEDTMGSMFGSYTLLWNQPVRLLTYTLITLLAAFIGYHIFYLFILSGFKFIDLVFGNQHIMGNAYLAVKQVGLDLFSNFNFLPSYYQWPACLDLSPGGTAMAPTISQSITGVITGGLTFLGYLAIPAYTLASLGTGFATGFIVLTKHKDDQDLIKRKDADERTEAEEAEEKADKQSDGQEADDDSAKAAAESE